jgi:hypothetical protein
MNRELLQNAFESESRTVRGIALEQGLWPTREQFWEMLLAAGHAEITCRTHGSVSFNLWSKDNRRVVSIEHDEILFPLGVNVTFEETRNNYKAADAIAFLRFERGLE